MRVDQSDPSVFLAPGEMVWYESARLLHGRPEVLEGDYYDNLFIHFVPTHWYPADLQVGQSSYRVKQSRSRYR